MAPFVGDVTAAAGGGRLTIADAEVGQGRAGLGLGLGGARRGVR